MPIVKPSTLKADPLAFAATAFLSIHAQKKREKDQKRAKQKKKVDDRPFGKAIQDLF